VHALYKSALHGVCGIFMFHSFYRWENSSQHSNRGITGWIVPRASVDTVMVKITSHEIVARRNSSCS